MLLYWVQISLVTTPRSERSRNPTISTSNSEASNKDERSSDWAREQLGCAIILAIRLFLKVDS